MPSWEKLSNLNQSFGGLGYFVAKQKQCNPHINYLPFHHSTSLCDEFWNSDTEICDWVIRKIYAQRQERRDQSESEAGCWKGGINLTQINSQVQVPFCES